MRGSASPSPGIAPAGLPIDDSDTSAGSPKGIAAAAAAAAAEASGMDDDERNTIAASTGAMASGAKAAAGSTDDLTRIEGIGPKIASLLQADGIETFSALASADAGKLKKILSDAGPRFALHDPASWPEQAKMAANADWDGLKALQDQLEGGRRT